MHITIHTDGGSLHNPGPAACAFVVTHNKKTISEGSFFLGTQTNNVAEYSAIVKSLEWAIAFKKKEPLTTISFICDSLLLVNQLNGLFKVKNARIRELVFKIKTLEQEARVPISYKHVLRELNQEADALVKSCLFPYHS